ncbi:MAG: histidine kinase [Pseudomonadota bacterium]
MIDSSSMIKQPKHALPLLPFLCEPAAILSLVIIGELLALVLVLANTSHVFSWSALGSISMVVQWIMLCCALVLCKLHELLNRLPARLSGCLAYSLCLVIAAVVLSLAQWLVWQNIEAWPLAKSMLIAAIFSGILLRYLYLQQQLSNQQQAELESRFQSLQSRIRPHFLFNSMNTIASLISISPQAAEETVEDLSHLFRSSLQKPGMVTLADELKLCKHYMAIEQRRLAERLDMRWQIPDPLPNIEIPSLLLQPLLENALYHGIQRLPEGGQVTLAMEEKGNTLLISIKNPTAVLPASKPDTGHHIALDNIRHRLQLHYGKEARLLIDNSEPMRQYSVTISIPILKGNGT